MNDHFFKNEFTLEEAAVISAAMPVLPYNPSPERLKKTEIIPFEPYQPVKAFDNVYWVGTSHVGAVIIDTDEGLIMIDSGSNVPEAEHIADSIHCLGLDPSKIKLLIISHEHFDHYGGIEYLLRNACPDAMVAISRVGWNLLQTVPIEFAFCDPRPEKADILLTDGMTLKLGNTSIMCIATPGHSAGCMSFIFNAEYRGSKIMVGMMGGSAVWPNYPELRLYQNSIEYFKLFTDEAGCNAYTGAHQPEAVVNQVRDSLTNESENPWYCGRENFNDVYLQNFRNLAMTAV